MFLLLSAVEHHSPKLPVFRPSSGSLIHLRASSQAFSPPQSRALAPHPLLVSSSATVFLVPPRAIVHPPLVPPSTGDFPGTPSSPYLPLGHFSFSFSILSLSSSESSSSSCSTGSPKVLWHHRLDHNLLTCQIHHDPQFHLLICEVVTLPWFSTSHSILVPPSSL